MPEIGEVARIVHYLRKHLVSRTVASVTAQEDDIVYGKVGCSASAFQRHVQGRKVTGAAQQGKYFYITFDMPPHAVLHFGMTGWMKFNGEDTDYYKKAKEKTTEEEWPPKYVKFLLKCEPDGAGQEPVEVAFVDARRLARIRLVDCKAEDIRKHTPLKENGPDPVVDKDDFTLDFLKNLIGRKRVPIKALLLDQANISGVGNWVGDEVLYQARLHPEQYSNTLDDEQAKRLHASITSVCTIAVETLADSKRFPDDWIMKYRWDKGKKDANVLPNGNKIVHLKVGGRTSAVVPAVQKKTAAVAGDVDHGDADEDIAEPARGKKRKVQAADDEADDMDKAEEKPAKKSSRGKTKKADPEHEKPAPLKKGGRAAKKAATDGIVENTEGDAVAGADATEDDQPIKPSKAPAKSKQAKKAPQTKAQEHVINGSRRSTRAKA